MLLTPLPLQSNANQCPCKCISGQNERSVNFNVIYFVSKLSKRQCFGHSGMLSFYIKGNNLEASKKFFKQLKVFTLAESLGGYESLCELP